MDLANNKPKMTPEVQSAVDRYLDSRLTKLNNEISVLKTEVNKQAQQLAELKKELAKSDDSKGVPLTTNLTSIQSSLDKLIDETQEIKRKFNFVVYSPYR